MTSPTYQQNKKHIYIWRAKNVDRIRAIAVKSQRWKRIKIEFFNILL